VATELPLSCDVVVIGGGIAGCSVAYHLAKSGVTDVVLLERRVLGCGTTWHAAGLVLQLRSTESLTWLARYTTELVQELERETGQSTGYRRTGAINVASDGERFEEIRRNASVARRYGIEAHVISPSEILRLWPHINSEDLIGGVYTPNDGQLNAVDFNQAYAKGARLYGAKIFEHVEVTGIIIENQKACGVKTASGDISARYVVNAAGMWARQLGEKCGVVVPSHAAEHFYVVTEPISELPAGTPVLRDPGRFTYFKEDAKKLLIGSFEPRAKPWGVQGIPADFEFGQLPDDWEHFEPALKNALHRVPMLKDVGLKLFFNGPESFTPDNMFAVGETPEVKRLFVATGFNSSGIQSSGGIGKVVADWILNGSPSMDLGDIDIRRFASFQRNRRYLRDRTVESLGLLHAMHWPFRQKETARPVRLSPFHCRLESRNACFGEAAGWERPNWFAPKGVKAEYRYSYGRQNWFEYAANEHQAVRNAVGLLDLSSFGKFVIQGPDAEKFLNHISANKLGGESDTVVYTPWLNKRGGIEADVTVTKLDRHTFWVITGAASQRRDLSWMRQHISAGEQVEITDITSGYAVLGIMGPRSRELLSKLTADDLSAHSFPFGTSREIDLAYARVRASRITNVGELGWELYIPSEFAVPVFDTIMAIAPDHDLSLVGYHAMNSLRMECGYRHWGHDITDQDTPLEAGLQFAVAFEKPGGFIGRDRLLEMRSQPRQRRLIFVALKNSDALIYQDEPIYWNGNVAGHITSGAYGYHLGCALGIGYISSEGGADEAAIIGSKFEVDIAGDRVPVEVSLKPFYDPRRRKVRL